MDKNNDCNKKVKCEIYSRVCGFYRPVDQFNHGKKEEYFERKVYSMKKIYNGIKE